ncbi:hypothetical protein L1987_06379 [Smallanthus sonchifolius]|uniref:Uncharacterized protein n=1 Tax=Smallanthus sonchifolius TaxID=185202 RepID=A0ACB9JY51_9ASTR|nr:hypothetical protein L1987_06379 [Smallanthus sonchifolius]
MHLLLAGGVRIHQPQPCEELLEHKAHYGIWWCNFGSSYRCRQFSCSEAGCGRLTDQFPARGQGSSIPFSGRDFSVLTIFKHCDCPSAMILLMHRSKVDFVEPRFVQDEEYNSTAARESGLARRTHTRSDLRTVASSGQD